MRDERDGQSTALRAARRTPDAVHIVLGIVGNVVVDDERNVVDINATSYDVRRHEHANMSIPEVLHYLLTLALLQVGVHGGHVEIHPLERCRQLLDLHLGGREDDHALGSFLGEKLLQERHLMCLIADVGRLHDRFRRTRYSDLDLFRVLQDVVRQRPDLRRHGSREHDYLTRFRELLIDLHNVVMEAHIEHAVGLVKDEEGGAREVHTAHVQVADQAAGRGDNDVGTHLQSTLLPGIGDAVGATVDSHGGDGNEVRKAVDLLIDLLRQFARRCHNDRIDRILWISASAQLADDGQHVGSRLASARLCAPDQVLTRENRRNGQLLNRRRLHEIHGLESVQHGVIEV